MDFISWSSSLFKFSGYEGITPNQLQQLQQQAGLLSTGWPWIPEQPNGANRPASSLILDLAVLEAAAANHFWHPTASSPFAMANFMSSTIMDKQHQLSFGIDRILGDQIGAHHRTSIYPQVPNHVWTRDQERQSLPLNTQRQEVVVDNKQVRETRQEHVQQQVGAVEEQQTSNNNIRRKRSWSRAVFSNLQRKGLEKRFQLQKYITKPDRRQLAATLGLTDAQVKVWFQNRRMKWRHNKESCPVNNTEETQCNSPLEHYIDTVENIECINDCNTTTAHVILPKDMTSPVRFSEFKKA